MQARLLLFDRFDQARQYGIVVKLARFDRRIDASQILIHHAPRTNIHVPHFRIAHLIGGQAHMQAVGVDQSVWALLQQPRPIRCVCLRDRIVSGGLAMTPAIQNQ